MRMWLLLLAVGCTVERREVDGDPCLLAVQTEICSNCFSGNVTCTYEDVSETVGSCGTCQAQHELYQRLCDEGVETVTGTVVCRRQPGPN